MALEMGKTALSKIYCSNPYGKKHAKIAKNKTFTVVTPELVASSRGLIPDLKLGDYICRTCKLRIYNFVKSLPVLDHDPEETESFCSSDDSADESEDEFTHTSVEKERLTDLFNSMHIPCEELAMARPPVSAAVKIYSRVKSRIQTIKEKLQLVTDAKTDISPRKPVQPKQQINQECKNCSTLLRELADRYTRASSNEEKYHILTTVPPGTTIPKMISTFGCTSYMAKTASRLRNTAGVFSHPMKKKRIGFSPALIEKVREFYNSDENSRVDPGIRNVVYVKNPKTGEKELQPRRIMWITLNEFHREFLTKFPNFKISVSAISLFRPKNVVWAGSHGHHISCTCIIHENFELLLAALGINDTLKEILESLYCSIDNDACMFGTCKNCPDLSFFDSHAEELDGKQIKYSYWGILPTAVGFQLLDKTVGVDILKTKLLSTLPNLAAHHFIAKKQKRLILNLREDAIKEENAAVIQVDFSQNYSFVTQNAVAGHHWSNNQATVHPFVVTWYSPADGVTKKKAFVVISDELKHDATTFHAFKVVVLRLLKKQGFNFNKLYFVSDGAASQFKCVKGFILLMKMEKDFGIKAEWHFYATSHGKSECDAIGATVKRTCRLGSLKRDPATKTQIHIRTLEEMVSYASKKLNSDSVEIVKVTAEDVQKISKEFDLESRFKLASTIPGTRMYHSFIPATANEILVRRYSSSSQEKKIPFLNTGKQNSIEFNIGDFVAVQLLQTYAIGKIYSESTEFGEYLVELMQKSGKGNSFRWPEASSIQSFSSDEILQTISPPELSPRHDYRMKPADFKILNCMVDALCL